MIDTQPHPAQDIYEDVQSGDSLSAEELQLDAQRRGYLNKARES